MNNLNEISKKKFLEVYNKHKPNLFLIIIYKYFSTTLKKNFGTEIIIGLMIMFNLLAAFFDKTNVMIRNICLMIANIPFGLWGMCGLIAFIMNNLRIKKIAKELEISIEEYNYLTNLYIKE